MYDIATFIKYDEEALINVTENFNLFEVYFTLNRNKLYIAMFSYMKDSLIRLINLVSYYITRNFSLYLSSIFLSMF